MHPCQACLMPKPYRRSRSKNLLQRLLSCVLTLAIGFVMLSCLLVLPWRWLPPPTSSFMLQTAWHLARPYRYTWVSYADISPYMALAVVASEDQRFPKHNGFDLEAIEQALEEHEQGESLRGASTISQQVAKNLYLWSGRSLWRKGLEAWFTVLIEVFWSKQRILETYLNIAQFGDREFGVEAASQRFFDKPAYDLMPQEAALLAAVLPAPEIYQVEDPNTEVWERQYWILEQMEQLGDLDYLQTLE